MQAKEFDLNIEKVLENWDDSHAVREIIANAIYRKYELCSNENES